MKRRYTDEQIIGILKEHEAGLTAKELCRKYGMSDATFYKWKAKWTHPGKVEAPYTVCIASASNLTGLVKSSVECRRTGL